MYGPAGVDQGLGSRVSDHGAEQLDKPEFGAGHRHLPARPPEKLLTPLPGMPKVTLEG